VIKKLLHSTSLKANIIANFVGTGWSALFSILFVPVYLKYIGAEGYGLIGIFTSLQIVLSLLDSGLSTTLNKEVARLSVLQGMEQKMLNVVKTLGSIYWLVALTAGLIAMALSPVLAKYWVQPQGLSVQTVMYAFLLLSLSLVFQFPTGFYTGGLLGLQRQVVLNLIRVVFATLRAVGAVVVLMFVSKTILAFFTWTLIISVLQAFVYKYSLWYYLPKANAKTVFDKQELKNIWRFAAGMTAISLTGILLTQTDKIVLSKILSLEEFGYYVFAFTLGSISYMIINPIYQSYFPRFVVLVTEGKADELKRVYHQACQMVTLLILPFALFLAFFSKEILLIWTNNSVTVDHTWQITSVISLAVAIHCLMFMPYLLCLSNNQTKLALYINITILIILIPSIIYAATHFGGLGGAVCWLSINIIYLLVNPALVHRLFLKGETFNWYWKDTIRPILGCIGILILSRLLLSEYHFGIPITVFLLALTGILAFAATLFSSGNLKAVVLEGLNKQFGN